MLTRIAPHLVKPVSFLYPLTHRGWERPYVTAGLTLYDSMGGARSMPRHKQLTRAGALRMVPALKRDALTGALLYYDAQADDARHTLTVAARPRPTARRCWPPPGSSSCMRAGERVVGARVEDVETGSEVDVQGLGRHQLHRRVDRRHPDDGRRPRPLPRARLQGRAHRRRARPDQLRDRADPAHREVGALRHPVGHALDHRHDRHRLGPRPGPPGGDARRHRLHPRAPQHRAQTTRSPTTTSRACTPACGRCCRARASDRASCPASTPSPGRSPGSSRSPAASTRPTASWRPTPSTPPARTSAVDVPTASPSSSRSSAPRATTRSSTRSTGWRAARTSRCGGSSTCSSATAR